MAKTHSVAERTHLLEPTAQIWMKIDPYMQQHKCRPMTLVSGNIRCVQIFKGVHLGRGVKWEWGCWRRQFLAIWVATSLESSKIRPAILCDDMLPLFGLWLIAKWITYNELEWLFHVQIRFQPAILDSERLTFTNDSVKSNSSSNVGQWL